MTGEEERFAIQGMEGQTDTSDIEYLDDNFLEDGIIESETKVQANTKRARPPSQPNGKAKKINANPTKPKVLKKEAELPIKIDLINLVKNERALYNLKDPLYMSRTNKEKVWSEICDGMKVKYPAMTIDECKRLWNAVRESTR